MIVEELIATLGLKVDTEEFAEAEGAIGKLKFAFGALAVGLGLHELKEMVHGVAEVADNASKSSQKLGMTAEAIQELGYAAKLSDVSQQGLEGSLNKLAKGLEKFETKGKGPVGDALKKLGISVKDLKGEGLDANLEVIADGFAKMADGQEKVSVATQLFGGAGRKMIPLLNQGSAGLREAREEAQKLGIVVSDETAKAFEEFNDDQTRVSEAWRGMRVQIVSALLPALHSMVTGILDWVKANEDIIKGTLNAVLTVLITTFQILGEVVGGVVFIVRELVKFLTEHTEVAEVLAGLILAYFMPAILAWAAAMVPLVAEWILLNLPIIAVIAAMAALILIINHWGDIWPPIVKYFSDAWDKIQDRLFYFIADVQNAMPYLLGFLEESFERTGKIISDGLSAAFEYLVQKAWDTGKEIFQAFKEIPVLGDSLAAGEFLYNYATGPTPAVPTLSDNSVNPQGGGGINATFGDTSITVNAEAPLDEAKVAKIAADAAAESQRGMLTQAYDSMKGGRR